MVVLSEVHYPAWKAYVDGKPVPLYVANHALRAVPVEAGTHQVELRYESRALRVGTIITFAFVTAAFTLLLAASWHRRKEIGRIITRARPVSASP